jgi:transposase InsO family protein
MDLARYVVDAVVLEGRSCREVARSHGCSKSWVAKVVARYREGGDAAIVKRSRAPKHIPHRTPPEVEDEVIRHRKQLSEEGFDAGAETIRHHLLRDRGEAPSVSTIWRILCRRGFVTPQPHKRPRSSWVRFEATLPNECWQSDVTHWRLGGGTEVEICNVIDDYSRLCVASRVLAVATAAGVLEVFRAAAREWGPPAAMLTDNGCVYTASHRHGRSAMESELLALGVAFRHSRPYHPQTQGKVERFHQTLKAYLAKQSPASSIGELQAQVDRFVRYYNEVRPHRARGRSTPKAAFESRDKARPIRPPVTAGRETRVRHDRVDHDGKVTLRYRSRLYHVGIGRAFKGQRVVLLVDALVVRVLNEDGELMRQFVLDPDRNYQPSGRPRYPQKSSTMSTMS